MFSGFPRPNRIFAPGIVLMAAIVLFGQGLLVQGVDGQNRRGGDMLDREKAANEAFVERLGLAAETSVRVDSIFVEALAMKQELFTLMRAGEMDRRAMRSAIGEIDAATEEKLAGVLSEEQLELYRAEMKARAANRRPRGRRGGVNPQ